MRGVTLAGLLLAGDVTLAAPTILWVSDPVRPDETVVLLTEGASATSTVEAVRLVDGSTTEPGGAAALPTEWASLKTLQAARQCVKTVL
ncbi:MAG: hypothetical protein FJX74_19115, partial [Armatimonadetes bacterium]|nr:hypothetical protein [Armatimonadota bacterium]